MKLYKKSYFNRRNYILEEMERLDLHIDEIVIVLLIDYCSEQNIMISHSILAQKTKQTVDEIDRILRSLTEKGYLETKFQQGKLLFDLAGIFEEEKPKVNMDQSLFQLFENEFKRTFSQVELSRISDWVPTYGKEVVVYALREAIINEKYSIDYIEKILQEWKRRELSIEDIQNGKR